MVADFVCLDFGFLVGPKTGHSARRVMKPGKNHDGYFTNEDILDRANQAINTLPEFGPNIRHHFIYDNASTHRKRADDVLSACHMHKNKPSVFKSGRKQGEMHPNFLVETNQWNSDGNPVYDSRTGKIEKVQIQMTRAYFRDGTPQNLYFMDGPDTGLFKGMENIPVEHGYNAQRIQKLKTQCGTNFNCAPDATDCCCRRILFNEPEFSSIKSLLEEACSNREVQVWFLPKFHCELNPIEQCWGYAKCLYCLCPESSTEEDLEKNALASLNAIPLVCFATRHSGITDAYIKGLNGKEASYAAKHYRGYQVIPTDYLTDFEKSGCLQNFKKLRNL
ncbi:hypothetical protein L218DRAFT_882390 [Marasmius fiardii PR-910]|nr:hypothetical protein L218DRAFT_882390 [Marasmius fiardii PR-910]